MIPVGLVPVVLEMDGEAALEPGDLHRFYSTFTEYGHIQLGNLLENILFSFPRLCLRGRSKAVHVLDYSESDFSSRGDRHMKIA